MLRFLVLVAFATICSANEFNANDIKIKNVTIQLGSESALMPFIKGFSERFNAGLANGRQGIEAVVNDYVDKVLLNIDNLMLNKGMDPAAMPDLGSEFEYKPFPYLITYSGEMKLTEGKLEALSSIHRTGDVIVNYKREQNKQLELIVPLGFNDLTVDYKYSAKIMRLGPTGGVIGQLSKLQMKVVLTFDCKNMVAYLDDYEITNAGKLTIHFTGHILVDWLLNILNDLTATLLKGGVFAIVELIVKGTLNSVVDNINDIISKFLNPTMLSSFV